MQHHRLQPWESLSPVLVDFPPKESHHGVTAMVLPSMPEAFEAARDLLSFPMPPTPADRELSVAVLIPWDISAPRQVPTKGKPAMMAWHHFLAPISTAAPWSPRTDSSDFGSETESYALNKNSYRSNRKHPAPDMRQGFVLAAWPPAQ
ncbi:unnamed protein product [Caretta caretta]